MHSSLYIWWNKEWPLYYVDVAFLGLGTHKQKDKYLPPTLIPICSQSQ